MAEFLHCTLDEAKARVGTSQKLNEWRARYEVAPFGQEALAEQIAYIGFRLLRILGDDEVELEDLKLSPFEFKRRDRDIEDLDDEEIDEMNVEAAQQLERQQRDMYAKRHRWASLDEE